MLLDRSGSMESIKADTIGGFNNFISEQKKVPGEMTLSLSQFDTEYEILYNKVSIDEVKPLTNTTFVPRGGTALLDSAVRLIKETGKKLANLSEGERPERVMVIILTDGEENSSHEYTKKQLREMIKHQEDVYKWQFLYIGANQDAFAEGAAMGMQGLNFAATHRGTAAMYSSLTSNVASNRGASRGVNVPLTQQDIDEEEKK